MTVVRFLLERPSAIKPKKVQREMVERRYIVYAPMDAVIKGMDEKEYPLGFSLRIPAGYRGTFRANTNWLVAENIWMSELHLLSTDTDELKITIRNLKISDKLIVRKRILGILHVYRL